MRDNYQKVLDVFFENSIDRFYVREIARKTKLNPNTVLNITNRLILEGLIFKEKKKHVVEFFANNDEKFRQLKIVKNLEGIYRSGLVEFLNKYFKHPLGIILFGSYRKGEDIFSSDIDIAVYSNEFKEYEIKEIEGLERFEKELGKEIQVHLFNKKINKNLFNNVLNGIVLSGFLEVD